MLQRDLRDAEPPAPPAMRSAARIDPQAIRAYDIRGVAGRQVTAAGVRALGLSYATLARRRGLSRVAVGRDGRLSSPGLERALVAGLAAGGLQVERIGLGPTPMLAFAVRARGLDGGVMVTASHNPPNENGLKLLLGAERLHGAALQELVDLPGRPASGGATRGVEIMGAYVEALAAMGAGLAPFKVAWDCGNGATGPAVEALVRRLPGRHIVINAAVDGRFPNHHPDPAVVENLRQLSRAVREGGCDLGVAFDGDGDRIGLVDGAGEPLLADHMLLFLARDLLARQPGATIVGDVKSSRLLFEGVRAAGGRAVVAPSGYVLLREVMLRERAALGGELSGHVFFADWRTNDDALCAAIHVLAALSRSGGSLEDFRRTLPAVHATPELRIPCTDAGAVVAQVAERLGLSEVDPAMGVRRELEEGWWLIRASGTEPKVTVRCEAVSEAGLERIEASLQAHLRACGIG